jgi:UDP-glucuronate decarboxylase
MGFNVYGIRGKSSCRVASKLHNCVSLDLLTDDFSQYIKRAKAGLLIHTSWETTQISYWNDPSNFQWTSRSILLIQKFFEFGGEKVLVTGSCAEYSWLTESNLSESSLEAPTSKYGQSKLDLLRYIQVEGVPYLWTRTFFQFGQDQESQKLIPSLIRATISGNAITLGNPDHLRDFIHIDDVITTLSRLILDSHNGVVNIGSGIGTKVSDVVKRIEGALGRKALVTYTDSGGPHSSVIADMSNLRSLLGELPVQPFAESIQCTIDEYSN